jgi:hypothetical protein
MAAFDAATLTLFHDANEVRIRPPGTSRGIIIWIVAVGDALFVRSFLGPDAGWYKSVRAKGEATLEHGRRKVAVRASAVADRKTIDAVSQAYLAKYASSSYAPKMVRDEILQTTLRVEPA